MMTIRHADERGQTRRAWLDSRHTFSFGEYYDPRHMQFGALRVINDDQVEAGGGFPMHPHRDMEILSIVLSGALSHQDSLGNGSVIRPGEIQRMSAGTGITHGEANASDTERVHFLQIWIVPERAGLEPGYEQTAFPEEELRGRLRLVASHDGRDGTVTIHQDVNLYQALLATGESATHTLAPGRNAWVQVARGAVTVNGETLNEGDGAAVTDETNITVTGVETADVFLFDLA